MAGPTHAMPTPRTPCSAWPILIRGYVQTKPTSILHDYYYYEYKMMYTRFHHILEQYVRINLYFISKNIYFFIDFLTCKQIIIYIFFVLYNDYFNNTQCSMRKDMTNKSLYD